MKSHHDCNRVSLRIALSCALCATLCAFGVSGCQSIEDAENEQKREQLEAVQDRDDAAERVTGIEGERR